MSHRTAITLAIGVALIASAQIAQADPVLDYNIGVFLEHSDNINYSTTDPISQNVLAPQLSFTLNEQGSAVTANAAGTLQYFDYLGGAFGNELRTLFSGVANWHISPGRFDWFFADNVSRQPINVFQSDAPSNQQQTNILSTGPTLSTKFNDVLRGQFDLRYTNSYADTNTDFNSNRLGALGTLFYELDPINTLSGALTASRTNYVETISQPFDYSREDAYAGYRHATRELTFEGAIGYSWLDIRDTSSRSGALLRGNMQWAPSGTTTLGVSVDHEYSDAAQDLVFTPGEITNTGIGTGLNNAVVAPQVYVESRVGLNANYQQDTFRLGFAPFWRKLAYIDDQTFDERSAGYYANGAWYFQPTFWLGGYAGQEHRAYTEVTRTDNVMTVGLSLNLQRTRHWLLSVGAEHQRLSSTAIDSSYTENSVMVSMTYSR